MVTINAMKPLRFFSPPKVIAMGIRAAAALALSTLPLSAQSTIWNGNGDGATWSDVDNWGNGLPDTSKQTRFTSSMADAPATINLTAPANIASLNFVTSGNRQLTFTGAELRIVGTTGIATRNINSSSGSEATATVTFNNQISYGHEDIDTALALSIGTTNNLIFNGGFTTFGTGSRQMTITGTGTYTFNGSNAASFLSFGGSGELIANHLHALGLGAVQKTTDSTLSLRSDLAISTTGSTGYSWLQNTTSSKIRISEVAQSSVNRTITMSSRISGSGNLAFVEHINSTGKLILSLEYSGATAQSLSVTTKSNGIVRFNQSGNTTYSGTFSGDGDVEVTGGGKTTFNTAHTFTGRMRIVSGTLALDGSGGVATTAGVELGENGVLDVSAVTAASYSYAHELEGNGVVISGGKNVTLSGALLAGDEEANLRFNLGGGALALADTLQIGMSIGAGSAHIQLIDGLLDIGNGVLDLHRFTFEFLGAPAGDYLLFEGASGLLGSLGEDTSGVIDGYNVELRQVGNNLVLTTAAIPEPSTVVLLVAGAFGWLVARRRGGRAVVMVAAMVGAAGAMNAEELPAKPLALVGDAYGKYDVVSITRNILDHADWVFESRGSFLPAEEFSRYALVVICHSQSRPYTEEEQGAIRRYLEQGGRLLLMHSAPKAMAGEESAAALHDWLGMKAGGIRSATITQAASEDPVMKGVLREDGSLPTWSAGKQGVSSFEGDVEVLMGNEQVALAARRKVGKGMVYYLGSELFRLRLPKSVDRADSPHYIALIRNIIGEAEPLTYAQWYAALKTDWQKQGQRFLVWDREWQRGTETQAIFAPPLPSGEELKNRLAVELAQEEYEAVQLNLTDLGSGGKVSWKIESGDLPPEAMTLYVQDRPDPIPWPKQPEIARESPFWLMPPEAVEPKGESAVKIASGETRIFWLKLHSAGAKPGSYRGRLSFAVDGAPAGEVALEIRVHPVKVPTRKLITAQPFGHVYGDVERPEEAMRFKRNLRDLGFEWSLINAIRPASLKVDGAPFHARLVRERLEAITSGKGPFIDFSAFDGFIDAALEHRLSYFRVTQGAVDAMNGVLKSLKLSEEESAAVRHWYLSEFSRYLRDKGIREFYASMGDEMSAGELRERFIPWSRELARSGWQTTSSFTTSVGEDLALARDLAPYVGAWTLNRQHVLQLVKWVRSGEVKINPGALIGTYGAGEGRGTEIRKNASESRMIGWEAWGLGSNYCAPNPYFKGWLYYTEYSLDRGVAGERFVSYLRKDDLNAPLVTSPFVEGMRESLEEANLAAVMSWYFDRLGDAVPAELRQRAGRILDDQPEAILRWTRREDRPGVFIRSDRDAYVAAKAEVLAILEALREPIRKANLKPDLLWHQTPLVQKGEPVAALVSTASAERAQEVIRAASSLELPIAKDDAKVAIVVAALDDPGLPESLRGQLGAIPESYSWIRNLSDPTTGKEIIWIGGTDAARLEKALRQFAGFLRVEGDWVTL